VHPELTEFCHKLLLREPEVILDRPVTQKLSAAVEYHVCDRKRGVRRKTLAKKCGKFSISSHRVMKPATDIGMGILVMLICLVCVALCCVNCALRLINSLFCFFRTGVC